MRQLFERNRGCHYRSQLNILTSGNRRQGNCGNGMNDAIHAMLGWAADLAYDGKPTSAAGPFLILLEPACRSDNIRLMRSRMMRFCKPYACLLIWLMAVVLMPTRIWAQARTTDPLKNLRGKSDLTADDLATLDNYLDGLISKVEFEPDDPRVGKRFRDQILRNYKHPANTAGFKQRLVERCSARFAEKIKSNQGQLAMILLYTLAAMSDPGTLPALKEAAESPNAAARVLAIRALSAMPGKIEAKPAKLSEVIQWLEEVGQREQDGSVLGLIYQTLDFTIKRDEQAAALINILEARLNNYQSNTVSGERAELVGLARAAELSSALGDPERKRLVGTLAKYLAYYTHRYVYADLAPKSRADLHRLVFMVERTITALTGIAPGNPSVSDAIASADPDRYDKIRAALESWVGSNDKTGRLNGSPWQVSAGAVVGLDFSAAVPEHPDDPT